ncbi:hypothetical protein BJF78_00640 [Pseudonocardia sp. CNS-139]|nr:hypothetical protein BJF78_00640 [Pseudonocardia sp. CNS-139]
MQRRRWAAAIAVACSALVVAGCAGAESPSGGDAIQISMIVPTETTGGNYPEEVSGAQAAVRSITRRAG